MRPSGKRERVSAATRPATEPRGARSTLKCAERPASTALSRFAQRSRMVAGMRSTATAASDKPTPLDLRQILLRHHAARGEVAGSDLRLDLDARVGGYQRIRNLHALADFDAAAGDGAVLVVAHADEAMDLADAEPVQHVGHQFLEAHVLHAGDAFGAQEVLVGAVAAELALACVVDQELGHFAQSAAFLAAVGDQPHTAGLRAADALFDRVGQVRPAGADV